MKIRERIRLEERDGFCNGALPSEIAAEFSIILPRCLGAVEVALLIHRDREESFRYDGVWVNTLEGNETWTIILPPMEVGLYFYHYQVVCNKTTLFFGGEEPERLVNDGSERQLLVFDNDFGVSGKLRGSMIYHVFVDRFNKGSVPCEKKKGTVVNPDWYNGIPQFGEYPGAEVANNEFFGGDLWGIIEKLDYICALGVDYIYLSPVFDAASNHKYDTGNYLSVDIMFGGDEALACLIEKAKTYGIGIILDGVFNHTGDDSIYFNKRMGYDSVGAYNSKSSEYFDWYTFNSWPDEYVCWWGVKILPRVDSANEHYKKFICESVVKKWMNMGVVGWRLDVADELSDIFLCDFRKAVKGYNKDSFIIGEVWEDASNKIAYGCRRQYLQGAQLDSVMNYPFRDAVISYIKYGDHKYFNSIVLGICRRYPSHVVSSLMNFLGTHDTARIITVLGGRDPDGLSLRELSELKMTLEEYEYAVKRVVCAYYLIGILPGALSVYYGDEIGMEGYSDPFCRRPFSWGEVEERIFSVVKNIGVIRKREKAFKDSVFGILCSNSDYMVLYRETENGLESVVALINRSTKILHYSSDDEFECLSDKGKTVRSIEIMPSDGAYIKYRSCVGIVDYDISLT